MKKKFATQLACLAIKNRPFPYTAEEKAAVKRATEYAEKSAEIFRNQLREKSNIDENITVFCGPLKKKSSTPYYKGKEKS